MVSLFKQDKIKTFEYFYFFVMVIYMGQINDDTSRMVGTVSGALFPFLLPIILTLILLDRNKVKFDDKRLIRICLLFAVWIVLLFTHKTYFGNEQYSYYFFLYYSIIIAYIHVQVFGKKMLPLYENIMMKLSLLSLVFWGIYIIYPGSASFFSSFPEAGQGHHIFYLYKWTDPAVREIQSYNYGILRNSGCSWEPGRFSIMLLLALYCNLARCGIKFKGNWSGIILLMALLSTQSTTGLLGGIVLYSIFSFKKFSLKYTIAFLVFVIPISYQLIRLDFMGNKIEEQLDLDASLKQINTSIDYVNKVKESNEYTGSLARFPSMYFELINIQHDPILGYGRNLGKSYFSQRISSNYVLVGGLLRMFGQYGIPLGIFLYIILFHSSVILGREFKVRKIALFTIYLISLTAYGFFIAPVFTAFWFYGLFRKEEDLILITSEGDTNKAEEETTEATATGNEGILPS